MNLQFFFHSFEVVRVFPLHIKIAALNGGRIQGVGEGDTRVLFWKLIL